MIAESNDDTVVGDFVVVDWVDAAFALDEEPVPMLMRTVGWITATNKEWLTVAQERDEGGTFHRAYTSILRANLRAVTRLQELVE